jgi:uncharacterized protein (DUF362 family)
MPMLDNQPLMFAQPRVHARVRTRYGTHLIDCSLPLTEADAAQYIDEYLAEDARMKRRLQFVKEIWIKPNITGAEPPSRGRTTQPYILACLLRVLRMYAPDKKIYVGDSSVIGCDSVHAAGISGILDVCMEYRIPFVDLRTVRFRSAPIKDYREIESLQINEPFLRKDVLKINLAKIKSTYGCPAALSIKNGKGCIPDETKLRFHVKGLQRCLCDLGRRIKWDLAILEALPCSNLGIPGPSSCMILSTDPVVADCCACLLFGVPLSDVEHLDWLAQERGLDTEALTHLTDFAVMANICGRLEYSRSATETLEKRFAVSIDDGRPCTACLESLAKALPRSAGTRRATKIVIGPDTSRMIVRPDDPNVLMSFIGKCSFDRCAMELEMTSYPEDLVKYWQSAIKVDGCPPTIDSMVESLSKGKQPNTPFRSGTVSKRIEQAFEIRPLCALTSATQMQSIAPLLPEEKVTFTEFNREKQLAAEVICASICQQLNWDFLRGAIQSDLNCENAWWEPQRIGLVSGQDVERILSGYKHPSRIRPHERAQMLRSLSSLFGEGRNAYCNVFSERIDSNADAERLIAVLESCAAFSEDTQRKKLQVLFHRLAKSGLVEGLESVCDPAIDYHIMRLYLRRGEVSPASQIGSQYIAGGKSRAARTVAAVRGTVADALRIVAEQSNLSIPLVNTIEWWIGRSVCIRQNPDCKLTAEASQWLRPAFKRCPFADNCFALNINNELLSVTEPELSKKASRSF